MNAADLHCNNVQCRKRLNFTADKKACITPCSHIFCIECGQKAFTRELTCPACASAVRDRDAIICVDLEPSEEFKSSVLAGLQPEVIMDICNRALSFWSYQQCQESNYHDVLRKKIENRYMQLDKRLQMTIQQANAEIVSLHSMFEGAQQSLEQEKQRNQELGNLYTDKCREVQKLSALYDKLKHKLATNPYSRQASTSRSSSGCQTPMIGNTFMKTAPDISYFQKDKSMFASKVIRSTDSVMTRNSFPFATPKQHVNR